MNCERAPQRIGLSATQHSLEEVARYMGGSAAQNEWRPVTLVNTEERKELALRVEVPVEAIAKLGEALSGPAAGVASGGPNRASIWPAIHPRLLELIRELRSTLIFVNSRRLAE